MANAGALADPAARLVRLMGIARHLNRRMRRSATGRCSVVSVAATDHVCRCRHRDCVWCGRDSTSIKNWLTARSTDRRPAHGMYIRVSLRHHVEMRVGTGDERTT